MADENPEKRNINPLLITAAAIGTAVVARQLYRYLRPRNRRPTYKSRSRHPQVARWESEGGEVPQVHSLKSHLKH